MTSSFSPRPLLSGARSSSSCASRSTSVAPAYVEHDPPDADPVELVRGHAEGKARSVHLEGRCDARGRHDRAPRRDDSTASPWTRSAHARCSPSSSGRTHQVVSGRLPARPGVAVRRACDHARHASAARPMRARSSATWRAVSGSGRAGGYAIQGLGARLVARHRRRLPQRRRASRRAPDRDARGARARAPRLLTECAVVESRNCATAPRLGCGTDGGNVLQIRS